MTSHKRIKSSVTCSDPEIFVGGRGGPGPIARKQP